MQRWIILIGVFLLVAIVFGGLVVVSGIVPIKASGGHFAITKWFLSFSMARSVSTHSIGIEPPADLERTAQILKGAGHFELGCAPCHGSPIRSKPRVAQQLTPTPPSLSSAAKEWTPAELFYIVKHGIKFTGMPAFPSQQRDDEVWAVVAFLLNLSELNSDDYHELVFGDTQSSPQGTPKVVSDSCARCHGIEGKGREMGAFPLLSGLPAEYLAATIKAYANGKRYSGIMEPIAARLNEEEIRQIADYFSSLPQANEAKSAYNPGKSDRIARGKAIAIEGIPDQDVGACVACHRLERVEQNPHYPILNGQPADYLVLQLELFQKQQRGGTDYAELMHPMVKNLKPSQMRDVAEFYASYQQVAPSLDPARFGDNK